MTQLLVPTYENPFRSQQNDFNNYALKHVTSRPSLQENPFALHANHIFDANGKKETIDSLLSGPDSIIWNKSVSNEFGRLAQGNDAGIIGTDTIHFIHKSEVPMGKAVTNGNFICDIRPLKSEKYRTRLTVGGDRLPYEADAGSPAASLLETKLILNSTISDSDIGPKFAYADLKDHFLATPMQDPEYMRLKYKYIPDDIKQKYKLADKVTSDGYVYIKIGKGMYRLKQASILAFQHLVRQLAPHGYRPCPYTTGLWEHDTRLTKFCLCVDDFGIKYFCKDDLNHLLDTLRKYYKISVDMDGKNYCGLSIYWDYAKHFVDISMPGFTSKTREQLQHKTPSKPQHAPHNWNKPAYAYQHHSTPL